MLIERTQGAADHQLGAVERAAVFTSLMMAKRDGKWHPDYKFYLNEGNKALQNEFKATKLPVAAVKKQYEIGVVLMGMAL